MTTKQLKQKYLKFFESKGHKIIPGASLIPENDPTVLFTTAGMHPLIPYLLGEKHPQGKKLVSVQKCIRTGDIEEVGDDVHLTFFEMLGNWSLGGYWKKEAVEMSFEFLTSKKWLGLDKNKLAISCFKGDPKSDIPKDEETSKFWQNLGIPKQRIVFLDRKENWWGPAGKTGPCGPDTEMFYWSGKEPTPEKFDPKDSQWFEIWNDVFMEYNKIEEGKYQPLKQKNIDTGMGVERTVAVLNDKNSVYEIEPLKSIINKVQQLGEHPDERSLRIITDHLRAAVMILGDEKGIKPSNVEQGYVLRRLIRRAIRYGKKIGIDKPFTFKVANTVIENMKQEYPELVKNKDFIEEQLVQEEEKFNKTLERGLKEFDKIQKYVESKEKNELKYLKGGKIAFDLYQTYGFPIEMFFEELDNRNIVYIKSAIMKGFNNEFKKHQQISRTATAGKFKSGLADHSEKVKKLHTATHLLLAALQKVLGEHVVQKGSNITAERLRFDFSHSEKLTDEEIKKVENLVNEQIEKDLSVNCKEMSLEEAKKQRAMGVFESHYGDKVKVYSINDFSKEICAGPHVKSTGELGKFKIKKEKSSSAGVRRIKAVLE